MPDVPARRIPLQPVPGGPPAADAPLAAFGGGAAAREVTGQAGALAGQAGELIQREQGRTRRSNVNKWEAIISREANRAQLEQGQLLGENALNSAPPTQQGFEDWWAQERKEIKDERTLNDLDQIFATYSNRLFVATERHEGRQRFFFKRQSYESGQAAQLEDTSNNFRDAVIVAENKARSAARARDIGVDQGWAKDAIDTEVLRQTSAHDLTTISRFDSEGMDIAAEEYFKANKDGMSDKDRENAGRIVELSSRKGKARRFVDEVMIFVEEGDWTAQEAIKQLNKITDVETQQIADSLLRRRLRDFEAENQIDLEQRYEDYRVQQDRPENQLSHPREWVRAEDWTNPDRMPASVRDGLIAKWRQNVSIDKSEDYRQTAEDDINVLQYFALDLRERAGLNPYKLEAKYLSKANQENRNRIINDWRSSRNALAGQKEARARTRFLATARSIAQEALVGIGAIPASGEKSKDDVQREARFIEEYDRRVDIMTQITLEGKRPPNPDELRSITEAMLDEVVQVRAAPPPVTRVGVVGGIQSAWGFVSWLNADDKKKYFALTEAQEEVAFVDDIRILTGRDAAAVQKAAHDEIAKALKVAKKAYTSERALELYNILFLRKNVDQFLATIAGYDD